MDERQLLIIEEFLSDWQSEDSVLSPIINNIKHSRFEDGHVKFLFCNNEEEQLFWKQHIGKYLHLYVFSLLKEWGDNNSNTVEKRCLSFWQYYKDSIKCEYYNFLLEICSVPISIHTKIGVLMDSHLWRENLETPYLSVLTSKLKYLFTDDIYLKYSLLLEEFLKTKSIDYVDLKMQNLIDFCNSTDIIISKEKCLSSIVNKFGSNNGGGVITMLKSMPHNRCSLESFKTIVSFCFQNYTTYRGNSYIPFCYESDACCFWKENAFSYSTALLYFSLKFWTRDNNNALELNYWLGMLSSGGYVVTLETEMKNLKDKIVSFYNDIPQTIVEEIGYMIEEYFWGKYNDIPSLIQFVVFPCEFVEKYKKMLLDKVNNNLKDYQEKLESYLQFCLVLDSNATFKKSTFLEILELTCDNESEKIANILELYPYYGDDFGLSLLQFCIDNQELYKLSNKTISKYTFHLFVDSWMYEISKRLGENGRPYNVELCEKTVSHKKIVDFLNHRHPILWNECNQKSKEIVNKIRGEKLTDKRSPVEERVKDMTKELTNREDRLLSGCLKPLIKEALKEGVQNFIIETESLAKNKGKKIPLLEDVSNTIYDYLIRQYLNFDVSEFPGDTGVLSGLYGDKVARIWIRRYMIGDDEVSWESSLSSEKIAGAKIAFDYYIWNNIYDHVIAWCEQNYGKKEPEEVYYSSDNYDDNDQDDYGIYRGGAFM